MLLLYCLFSSRFLCFLFAYFTFTYQFIISSNTKISLHVDILTDCCSSSSYGSSSPSPFASLFSSSSSSSSSSSYEESDIAHSSHSSSSNSSSLFSFFSFLSFFTSSSSQDTSPPSSASLLSNGTHITAIRSGIQDSRRCCNNDYCCLCLKALTACSLNITCGGADFDTCPVPYAFPASLCSTHACCANTTRRGSRVYQYCSPFDSISSGLRPTNLFITNSVEDACQVRLCKREIYNFRVPNAQSGKLHSAYCANENCLRDPSQMFYRQQWVTAFSPYVFVSFITFHTIFLLLNERAIYRRVRSKKTFGDDREQHIYVHDFILLPFFLLCKPAFRKDFYASFYLLPLHPITFLYYQLLRITRLAYCASLYAGFFDGIDFKDQGIVNYLNYIVFVIHGVEFLVDSIRTLYWGMRLRGSCIGGPSENQI